MGRSKDYLDTPTEESAMPKILPDVAEMMRDIDYCMLSTITSDGAIASRPMSNNNNVEFDGDSWFYATEDAGMVAEIDANSQVGVTYAGSAGLAGMLGKPGAFIHLRGQATLVRDKGQIAAHWEKSLDRWYAQGKDTPGIVMIRVHASSIHYWDGEAEGEVSL